MLFLPYKKLQIHTKLSPDEVLRKIENNLETNLLCGLMFYDNNNLFRGKIEDNYFKITRIIKYCNSFLPVIEGKVNAKVSSGSIIILWIRQDFQHMRVFIGLDFKKITQIAGVLN